MIANIKQYTIRTEYFVTSDKRLALSVFHDAGSVGIQATLESHSGLYTVTLTYSVYE